MPREPLSQSIRSPNTGYCGDGKGEVHRHLRPSEQNGDQGNEIAGQGGVLGHVRHRLGASVPVDLESVEVGGVLDDLAAGPEKEWVVDVERFGADFDASAVRDSLELGDVPVIMFVGGFQHWHGLDKLVESFARVVKQHPGAKLLLVGDGPVRAEVERQSTELGLSERVIITGFVPHNRIPELLSVADVVTLPYPELPAEMWFSPLKLYEYMAAGKAIVASEAGQIADVIQSGHNGLLVQPGSVSELAQAISRLLENKVERERLGQNARRQAIAEHSWDRYTGQIKAVYASILS